MNIIDRKIVFTQAEIGDLLLSEAVRRVNASPATREALGLGTSGPVPCSSVLLWNYDEDKVLRDVRIALEPLEHP